MYVVHVNVKGGMNASCTKWMLEVGMYEWMWVCRQCVDSV